MRHRFNVVPRLQDDTGGHSPKGVTLSYNITAWRFGDLRLSLPKDFDVRRWLLAQPDRDEKGSENTGKRWCLEDGTCAVLVDPAARTWTLKLLDPALSGILADDDSLVLT